MRRLHNTFRPRNESGFTLIEVTLALAVALVGMLAVLGLLPQGMQSARSAADNTVSATIANEIFATIRSQAFNTVDFVDLGGNSTTYPLTTYANTPSSPLQLYFDYRGVPTNTLNGAYYQANVVFQPPSPNPGSVTAVTVILVWPALAKFPANTNIFATSVTAYP